MHIIKEAQSSLMPGTRTKFTQKSENLRTMTRFDRKTNTTCSSAEIKHILISMARSPASILQSTSTGCQCTSRHARWESKQCAGSLRSAPTTSQHALCNVTVASSGWSIIVKQVCILTTTQPKHGGLAGRPLHQTRDQTPTETRYSCTAQPVPFLPWHHTMGLAVGVARSAPYCPSAFTASSTAWGCCGC